MRRGDGVRKEWGDMRKGDEVRMGDDFKRRMMEGDRDKQREGKGKVRGSNGKQGYVE